MSIRSPEALRQFNPVRILGPIFLGLVIVGDLIYIELIKSGLSWSEVAERLAWTPRAFAYGGLALVMVVVREGGYIWPLSLPDRRCFGDDALDQPGLWPGREKLAESH